MMSKKKKFPDKSDPQKHCANYNSGMCIGIQIGSHLQQWVDSNLYGKRCRILDKKECDYFIEIVEPIL